MCTYMFIPIDMSMNIYHIPTHTCTQKVCQSIRGVTGFHKIKAKLMLTTGLSWTELGFQVGDLLIQTARRNNLIASETVVQVPCYFTWVSLSGKVLDIKPGALCMLSMHSTTRNHPQSPVASVFIQDPGKLPNMRDRKVSFSVPWNVLEI